MDVMLQCLVGDGYHQGLNQNESLPYSYLQPLHVPFRCTILATLYVVYLSVRLGG
jgi:hypothetical protein